MSRDLQLRLKHPSRFFLLPSFFKSKILAIEREEIAVACGQQKIEVRLEKDYLIRNGVNVANREQLHMGENTACIPIEEENAYKFVIFAPFNTCFTKVEHETEDYVYSNQIYYNTTRQATEGKNYQFKNNKKIFNYIF